MYSEYLSDKRLESMLSDDAFITEFLRFERTVATAQESLAIIPQSASEEIQRILAEITIEPTDISRSFLENGIPTLAILAKCRQALSPASRPFLHHGMTSQDAIDTAHMCLYKNTFITIHEQLSKILKLSPSLVEDYSSIFTVARTRHQQAGPISYGLRMAQWLYPLLELHQRYKSEIHSGFYIQLGGAWGTNAALSNDANQLGIALANALGLQWKRNWQTNRLPIKKLADHLVNISACVGKIAKDILFLSATEVGEIRENAAGGGKSSAMPHKSNPVRSEAILALTQENQIESLKINQAMMPLGERDASVWILEWAAMKKLLINAATCLQHLHFILDNHALNPVAIARNLEATQGLIFTTFAKAKLLEHFPLVKTQNLIQQAIELVKKEEIPLAEVLNRIAPLDQNWDDFLQASNFQGQSAEMISSYIEQVKSLE